ncbi:MAG: hypothetical protein LBU40_04270 [Methanobrevibacter sp.]|jgi:hypothetical protein|nr:hypothetical protein [Methanobrevibacter sp.]
MQKITFLKFILDKTDDEIIKEIENNESYQCFLGYPEKSLVHLQFGISEKE